ncbi:hypothetical protein GH714_022759 [Hevea brasiliensis]|uniref:Uncharacterized protein n=1 Tax=Hevea brasiliensis TaxID=3981 RepID=A0A6A6M6J4_HEVBR|nr:hypothetical protein GH714_022759 [Hevea brasiliensis]
MAREEEDGRSNQEKQDDPQPHLHQTFSSYIGLSFSLFLASLPSNSFSFVQKLQSQIRDLSLRLFQAEEQLKQMKSRRKEDSKANARVVEIFASHRNSWQAEEKRLLQQIDAASEEMASLRARIEDFQGEREEWKARIQDLEREDMHYEPVESLYHMKHFVARRESPWKVDGESTGISSKLKLLEQELQNLEKVDKNDLSKVPSLMRKQAKRYQALAGKIDDLCRRLQASDPCESTLSPEFSTQRQTEFLLEAFRLQQRASETAQKLMALQTEVGKSYYGDELGSEAKLSMRRSFDSIRNNLKEVQRNLEIWLARIIGDLEGILARDGVSRANAREYYVSRYPFVQ